MGFYEIITHFESQSQKCIENFRMNTSSSTKLNNYFFRIKEVSLKGADMSNTSDVNTVI